MKLNLGMTGADVAYLTASEREERLDGLVARAHALITEAQARYGGGRHLTATCLLYSGGNDSTTLAHLMRGTATHAIHANTGVGVEATRQFVRAQCATWGIPLIEKHPPVSYADLVRERGFPGPAQHWKMYARLKERCLDAARHDLGIANSRTKYALFLAGRRRDESKRRIEVPLYERDGSVVWVSPLAEWTALDLNTYRLRHRDVPRNPVADALHMSGECLCGAFAKRDELAEVEFWYPADVAAIRALEAELATRLDLAPHLRTWGWGAYRDAALIRANGDRPRSGRLCSTCDGQMELPTVAVGNG